VLGRLVYLAASNAFAALRLLPMGDRDKDIEILALRHQISVCSGNSGLAQLDSSPPIGRFWPPYLRRHRARRCGACS
jgi:hypothetical protein